MLKRMKGPFLPEENANQQPSLAPRLTSSIRAREEKEPGNKDTTNQLEWLINCGPVHTLCTWTIWKHCSNEIHLLSQSQSRFMTTLVG